MNKLQHALDRIEKLNFNVKRVDIYGEVYNYSVRFIVILDLEEGQHIEVTMMEMYGQNLCDYYEEIISFYDKFISKCEKYIKDNYDFNVRINKITKEK